VVAEGVETAQEARLLSEMSCDVLQGYFIAKPMPQAEFERFVQRWRPVEFIRNQMLDDDASAA
jgi:EAL domain-containing protein (putative c-di-GMP-specific phosphodiesterase class I)